MWLLRAVGLGLVTAGLGHAWLPRGLGWARDTHREGGPVSALVIRMHVWAVGLFLIGIGVCTIVGARELLTGERLSVALLASAVIIFALRWAAEIVWVSRALRSARYQRSPWRLLHAAALVIWPVITGTYLAALLVNLSG